MCLTFIAHTVLVLNTQYSPNTLGKPLVHTKSMWQTISTQCYQRYTFNTYNTYVANDNIVHIFTTCAYIRLVHTKWMW